MSAVTTAVSVPESRSSTRRRRPVAADRCRRLPTSMATSTPPTGRKGRRTARPVRRIHPAPDTARGAGAAPACGLIMSLPRAEGLEKSLVGVEGPHGEGNEDDDGHGFQPTGDATQPGTYVLGLFHRQHHDRDAGHD